MDSVLYVQSITLSIAVAYLKYFIFYYNYQCLSKILVACSSSNNSKNSLYQKDGNISDEMLTDTFNVNYHSYRSKDSSTVM